MLVFCFFTSGCAGPGFYAQAVKGHADVIRSTTSIKDLNMGALTKIEQKKIKLAVDVRDFAERQLLLPSNGSFHSYAKLNRRFVVWNVFATTPFSLAPKNTCFLVAGCVPYRGFYSKAVAEKYSRQLAHDGFEVYLAGIGAYSTLGWFNDPLLSTVINRSDEDLAELIFHELAHQKIYIKNDAVFNESFATAIAQEGVKRWLELKKIPSEKIGDEQRKKEELTALIIDLKRDIEHLYNSDKTLEEKRVLKKEYFETLRADYEILKDSWETDSPYDDYMYESWNNPKLMAFGAYHQLVPNFKQLIEKYDGDLSKVYLAVEQVKNLTSQQRRASLFLTKETK
jgi:predicted aminopeptidase